MLAALVLALGARDASAPPPPPLPPPLLHPLPPSPLPSKPNKRVPHAAATFVQGTGAAASSGWQPTGTTGTAKLQSSWSHKHPLTKEPQFACDIKNSSYTAMLKTLDAAHPDLFDVLQLPEHSSFLFSGTSFMREIHDNFRAANAHRQQRIEQCLVDTSAAATNGSLLFHCEEGFTPSPHVRAIYRVFYSCLLYTSPSPRDGLLSRMPSSA